MNRELTFIDASRIQDYQTCPRYYMFKHVLGWQSDEAKDINLVFGQAWHLGQEALLKSRSGSHYGAVDTAIIAFLQYYGKHFTEDTDLQNFPKNPGVAWNAFLSYISDYDEQDLAWNVIHTEVRDSIDLGWGIPIAFRIDAIVKDQRGIIAVEHKTSSMLFSNWADQWHEKPQIYIYMAACKAFYGEIVNRMIINGSFFRKGSKGQEATGNVEHLRLPVIKDDDSIELGLRNLRVWVERIKNDYELLNKELNVSFLLAFPKAGTSCIQYMKPCRYQAYCQAYNNPCIVDCPAGMRVKFWDPRVEEEE